MLSDRNSISPPRDIVPEQQFNCALLQKLQPHKCIVTRIFPVSLPVSTNFCLVRVWAQKLGLPKFISLQSLCLSPTPLQSRVNMEKKSY
jgi:hypothetical protein